MASIDLIRLLAELKRVASPVQRMKLVARAWRSVSGLAPGERRELAAHVGLEGAEELLERLASRGGSRLSPSLLLRALDRIRGTEAHEVSGVVDSLRDPRRRKELVRRGLEALAPEEPSAAEPVPPEPAVVPVPSSVSEEPEPERPCEKPEAKPPEEPPPEPPPEPPAPTEVEEPPPPVIAVADAPTPAPPPPAKRVEPELPETPPVGDEGLIDRIERAASSTERFRLLRRRLDRLRGLSPDQLGRLLEMFPAGWQRRRALAALLRAGIPETAHQAISLIKLLELPRSQRWCASIMLDRWTLTSGERGALIERHRLFRHRA